MGDWSDAMEHGVICRGCALPLDRSDPGLCPECAARERGAGGGPRAPTWIPDDDKRRD
jgi:hypothetical protein